MNKVLHDLSLDRISAKFNELKYETNQPDDDVELQVIKDLGLNMFEIGKGRDARPVYKTLMYAGKYNDRDDWNSKEERIKDIEEQVSDNYFVMYENQEYK